MDTEQDKSSDEEFDPNLLGKESLDEDTMRKEQIKSLKWAVEQLKKEESKVDEKLTILQQIKQIENSLTGLSTSNEEANSIIAGAKEKLNKLNEDNEKKEVSQEELISIKDSIRERLEKAHERLNGLEGKELEVNLQKQLNPNAKAKVASPAPVKKTPSAAKPTAEELARESMFADFIKDFEQQTTAVEEAPKAVKSNIKNKQPARQSVFNMAGQTTPLKPIQRLRMDQDTLSMDLPQPQSHTASMTLRPETKKLVLDVSEQLGLTPNELMDRGIAAVMRMIIRNNGRVTFPMEVQQIDLGD